MHEERRQGVDMQGWVRTGATAMGELGGRLDALHEATATPLTARRPWLECWLECYRDHQQIAVGVDAPDGSLAAVALLASRRTHGVTQIVAVGDGPSDAMMIPARDDRAARVLAEDLVRHLAQQPRPWRMVLRHLVAHDLVAPHLTEGLRHARLVPGDVSPVLSASSGGSLDDYVTSSHRRGVARLHNRLAREGVAAELRHLRTVPDVAAMMPEVERVCRSRDVDMGRVSALDIPQDAAFFRAVIERHAELDQVRLTVLTIEGRLAAYVLCFVDGSVSRMWNCRFDPAYARFSPGKVAMDESVAHALAEGSTAYDFMRGEERYKSSFANDATTNQDLYAASGPLGAVGNALFLAARSRVREKTEAGNRPHGVVAAAKRLHDRRRVR